MGEQEKNKFRFITDSEFLALTAKERLAYLVRAGEELERRRQALSVMAQLHIQKEQKGE
jgi:hypothetical protein